ncbi:MAG: sugar phosphate isomerase/epimerase family protein [Planctomycetota bacterium]
MRNCLFSVSYAGLWGQERLSLSDFVVKARALGYEGIEIMCKRPHLYPYDAGEKDLAALKELIAANHLAVACMAAYTNFTAGGESREVPLADLQVSYVREIARIGSQLGCGLVRIFTGYENAQEPFGEQWKMCVKAIQACCDAANPFGVTIGVQNHHDIAVDTHALLELSYEIDRPNLGLMVDAWTMFLRGEDIEGALRKVGRKLVFCTAADYVILPRYSYRPSLVNYEPKEPALVKAVPIGEGMVDYQRYFKALKDIGYDGWVSYETCSPLRHGGSIENLDRYARRFLESRCK